MSQPNIISIFPTAIFNSQLDRKFTSSEMNFFDKNGRDTRKNMSNSSSNDFYVLEHPEMADIKKFLQTQLDLYIQTVVRPKNDVSLRITQSWLNYTKPHESHHAHIHSNSYVSGVLYIKANDRITFFKDDREQIRIAPNEYNTWNSLTWWLEAKSYNLYIFPSSLSHSVDPVDGYETRVSLAFNTFPVGLLGDHLEFNSVIV